MLKILILFILISGDVNGSERDNLNYFNWISSKDFHKFRFVHSNHIERYRNVQIDPCSDFYGYACGYWKNFHPNDYVATLQRKRISFLAKRSIKNANVTDDAYVVTKAKKFYASCMSDIAANGADTGPLVNFLKGLASWPAYFRNWRKLKFDWMHVIAQCRKFGLKIFIDQYVSVSAAANSNTLDGIHQIFITCPDRQIVWDYATENYLKKLKVRPKYLHRMMRSVIGFDVSMRRIPCPDGNRIAKMNLKTLTKLIPEINWKLYLTRIQNRPVHDIDVVNVSGFQYFKKLSKLINKTRWNIVADYIFVKIANYFQKYTDLKSFGNNRDKFCFHLVKEFMNDVLNFEFKRQFLSKTNEIEVRKMTVEMKTVLSDKILQSLYYDNFLKRNFVKKLNNISYFIGGIPLYNERFLNKSFSNVPMKSEKFFENLIFLLWNHEEKEQSKVGQRKKYTVNSYQVNAFYGNVVPKGSIVLPTGILQPPFYHQHIPRFLSYAGIGHVIAHEMMHAFDLEGLKYDFRGKKGIWYNHRHSNMINKRFMCFLRQCDGYNDYKDALQKVNENMADSEGLSIAFQAFKNWMRYNHKLVHHEMKYYTRLNLTSDQLLFLTYAQGKCGSFAGLKKLNWKSHSDPHYRVNGAVSNSRDFARTFHCPINSPMNPIDKCRYLS